VHSQKVPSLLPTPAQIEEVLGAAASLARPGTTIGAGSQSPTIENDHQEMRLPAKRHSIRKSSPMDSSTPTRGQPWISWYMAAHGGSLFGVIRPGAPLARASAAH
jgi:hypothetical protein